MAWCNSICRSFINLHFSPNFLSVQKLLTRKMNHIPSMADRLVGSDKSLWVEYGKLAVENQATNLGQGFPDFFPPTYIQEALKTVALSDNPFSYQYTRSYGHPHLVNALSKIYSSLLGRDVSAMNEILITVGAYGSLYSAVNGLLNPGDEAIIIEPFFDCYEPMVRMAGGVPVFVPLKPSKDGDSSGDWKLDSEEFASKFNSKTKILFFNTPNNPLGKVYKRQEMEMIADLCRKHNVICLADEVYEHLIYTGNEHVRIATLPGMWERTITIGSAGKTFGVTGWKTGWSIGPDHLLKGPKAVHQNSNYTCITPIQEAIAIGFETEFNRLGTSDCYFNSLPRDLEIKRDMMADVLRDLGLQPIVPEGGYFMMADYTKLGVKVEGESENEPKDCQFVKWLTKTQKLATIPLSVFYSEDHKHLGESYIRICFSKKQETLDKAASILKEWRSSF